MGQYVFGEGARGSIIFMLLPWFCRRSITQQYNSCHKQWGYLLQRRYKALLADASEGEYFLNFVPTFRRGNV